MKMKKISYSLAAVLIALFAESAFSAGCDDNFSYSATYGRGSKVTVDGVDYVCVDSAYSIYCSGNKPPGKPGTFATVAWKGTGACSETSVAVVSGNGCEATWASGNQYKSGDRVAADGSNYQCVSNAYSLYCPSYKPGSGSMATLAWESLGTCSGTIAPTPRPTAYPTNNPTTSKPTTNPTPKPTSAPTSQPTSKPTSTPTAKPTSLPTVGPTAKPTSNPTTKPTSLPTAGPTAKPTSNPTAKPTSKPTAGPTAKPTSKPTAKPTSKPTAGPTAKPTSNPTAKPTSKPTAGPTSKPTSNPTAKPTSKPTSSPTLKPTPALANASNPGCPRSWVSGTTYQPNDQVAVGNLIYQCDSVYFAHCPYRQPGTVLNDESWELLGSCVGTLKPTNSPTVNPNAPPCPAVFNSGVTYDSGARVSVGKIYYQCKAWPYTPYCSLYKFEPGSSNSDFGWMRMGSCV